MRAIAALTFVQVFEECEKSLIPAFSLRTLDKKTKKIEKKKGVTSVTDIIAT